MKGAEAKLIVLGIALGVLIAAALPAKIVPLAVVALSVYVNRRDILRGIRRWGT